MPESLTNLLPYDRWRALSREYVVRLLVVLVMLTIVYVIIAGVLLLPTYVFLSQSAQSKEARIASLETSLTTADEVALSARLASLSANAARLVTLAQAPSLSTILRAVLEVSRPGIKLHGFTYTPAVGGTKGILTVSGTSLTRDALRNYQLALQSSPTVTGAELPVSAYAKDTDISFTITLTLAP